MPPKVSSLVTLSALAMLAAGSGISPPLPGARSGRSPYPGGYPRGNDRYVPPSPEAHKADKRRQEIAEMKRARKAAKRLGVDVRFCGICNKPYAKGVDVAEHENVVCSDTCGKKLERRLIEAKKQIEESA